MKYNISLTFCILVFHLLRRRYPQRVTQCIKVSTICILKNIYNHERYESVHTTVKTIDMCKTSHKTVNIKHGKKTTNIAAVKT